MTTYVVHHPMLNIDIAKFKEKNLAVDFIQKITPEFRECLVLQNWAKQQVTLTRTASEMLTGQ